MAYLFQEFRLKDVVLRNRICVSPMCQYSSEDGFPNDWHLVHLGSRAVGGAGLVVVEATAVSPEGRISLADSGIWSDEHVEPFARIARFLKQQGAVPGIQLAHAGRKASANRPWEGDDHLEPNEGAWEIIGPSPIAFGDNLPVTPREMTVQDIVRVREAFVAAAKRSLAAGFEWLELHFAHGYLAHSFFSPLSNHRTDAYGGSFDNRIRFLIETFAAVRKVWPERLPLWHGCQWSTHTILGENPWAKEKTTKDTSNDMPSGDAADWKWIEPAPSEWRPQVNEEENEVTVTFFTFSGLGQEVIHQFIDRFHRGSYSFESERKEIATGSGGYMF